jgi:hypothetical protein
MVYNFHQKRVRLSGTLSLSETCRLFGAAICVKNYTVITVECRLVPFASVN